MRRSVAIALTDTGRPTAFAPRARTWSGPEKAPLIVQLVLNDKGCLDRYPPLRHLIAFDRGSDVLDVHVMYAFYGDAGARQGNLYGILDRIGRNPYQVNNFFNHISRS
jgi:hypothetical protein